MGLIRNFREFLGYHLTAFARKVSEAGYVKQSIETSGLGYKAGFELNGEKSFVHYLAAQHTAHPTSIFSDFCWVDVGANTGSYTEMLLQILNKKAPQVALRGVLFEPQVN